MMNARFLVALVSFSIPLGCAMVGCRSSSPTSSPTVDQIRRALIGLTEEYARPAPESSDECKQVLWKYLKAEDTKAALEAEKATIQGSMVFLAGWSCDLTDQTFYRTIGKPGGAVFVRGRFQRDEKGTWKAEVTGIGHEIMRGTK